MKTELILRLIKEVEIQCREGLVLSKASKKRMLKILNELGFTKTESLKIFHKSL